MKSLWENKQAYTLLVAFQSGSTSSTLAIAIKMEDFIGPRDVGHLFYRDTTAERQTDTEIRISCSGTCISRKDSAAAKNNGAVLGGRGSRPALTDSLGWWEYPTSLLCHVGTSCWLQEAAEPLRGGWCD